MSGDCLIDLRPAVPLAVDLAYVMEVNYVSRVTYCNLPLGSGNWSHHNTEQRRVLHTSAAALCRLSGIYEITSVCTTTSELHRYNRMLLRSAIAP
jgi:hypothetical protein